MKNGDKIIITFKNSKYYLRTGTVINVNNKGMCKGDCTIILDFTGDIVTFFESNIKKIIYLVEKPSGEVVHVPFELGPELISSNLIYYDFDMKSYYFLEKNRFHIDGYIY